MRMEISAMLSSSCWTISSGPVANLRVRESGHPICVRHLGSWNRTHETKRSRKPNCSQNFSCTSFVIVAHSSPHSRRLHSHKKWLKLNSRSMLGQNFGPPNCCTAWVCASNLSSPKESGIGVPYMFGKSLSAYADFNPAVQEGAGVKVEVIRNSVSSVESILAKELAHRFREMSDEELVDILQQLLEASRYSFSPRNLGGDGTVTDDIVTKKEGGQLGMKTDERIRAEDRVPMMSKAEEKTLAQLMDKRHPGTRPADSQVDGKTDSRSSDNALSSQPQEADGQGVKKTGERIIDKGKVTKTQQEGWPSDTITAEKVTGDSRLSKSQQTIESGTPEIRSGDASGTSQLRISDDAGKTGAAVELSLSSNADKRTEDDENVTRLLWDEWIERLEGQNVLESGFGKKSSSPLNSANLWRSLQTFGINVVTNVQVFTAGVFGGSNIVGFIAIWPFFLGLAFYLGRLRASSREGVSDIKEAPTEDQDSQNVYVKFPNGIARGGSGEGSTSFSKADSWESGPSQTSGFKEFVLKDQMESNDDDSKESYIPREQSMAGQPNVRSDQGGNEKWWKRQSTQGVLKATEEVPATSFSKADSWESGPSWTSGFKEVVMKDQMESNDDNGEDSYILRTQSMAGQPNVKSDQGENQKWWKRQSTQGFLKDTEEASARRFRSTSNRSSGLSAPGTNGGLTQEEESTKYNLMNRISSELAGPLMRGPGIDETISYKMGHMSGQQAAQEEPIGSMNPPNPRTVSALRPDATSSSVRPSGSQPHSGMSSLQSSVEEVKAKVYAFNDWDSTSNQMDQGTYNLRDPEYTSDSSKSTFITTGNLGNLDTRRRKVSTRVVQAVNIKDKGRNFELQEASERRIPREYGKQANRNIDTEAFRMTMVPDSNADIGGIDSLKDGNTMNSGGSNGSWRDAEIETPSKVEAEPDSFVHNHILWVRDADGVFIQQPHSKKDREWSDVVSFSRPPQDMRESSKAGRSSEKLGNRGLSSTAGPKESAEGSWKRFDYRQLCIEPRMWSQLENQQGHGTSVTVGEGSAAGTANSCQQMLPLRYGSNIKKTDQ